MAFVDLSNPQQDGDDNSKSQSKNKTADASVSTNTPKLTVPEDHDLMRDIPPALNGNNTTTTPQGVKEMSGPPVSQASSVKPAVASIPEAPLPPVQNTNTPSAPVLSKGTATSDRSVILTGSAVGKEQQVKKIMENADSIIQQENKSKVSAGISGIPATKSGVKTPGVPNMTTAGEKFLSDKATLVELLSLAEKRNASDLHISVGYPPLLRVDGSLTSVGGKDLDEERIKQLFAEVMTEREVKSLKEDLDVDFSYTHHTGTRFRVNIYHKKGTMAGAFRLIPSRIRTIAELGLPQILYDMISIPQGLVLLAGPTGSGKSTTIASMVQEINLNQPKHILTIEDPIEYIFPKGKAMVNQREVGVDVTSFKRGLREVLREDPDIVLIGEMRDFETIAMTITTAETGHLVFATLHTNSASQTIDRIIDVFPDAQQAQVRAQLANVIAAVVSQRLVPVKSGGRKAVVEIMIATPAIRNAIREAKTYQIDNMIQTNAELGMITLEKSLMELIRSGEVTLEQAQGYTTKPDELISLMKTT